ncbi:MAG: 7-carboxy-7-deazaguanine synthase QueE [Sedimentisphaerales bacterium]
MKVSEIFYSLQGEGFLAGIPSVFVRLAGCPLRCKWCDTKYAWDNKAGENYSIEEIFQAVQQGQSKFIVITGGEPMTNPDLPELVQKLKASGRHITIETAGIVFVPDLACDLMSISPKLSNAGSRPEETILCKLIDNYKYQLKFVVDSQDDLAEIQQIIEKLGNVNSEKVMLMPQGATKDELLAKSPMVAEMCKRTGFAFCNRLQVLLWNNKRGM